MGIMWRVVALGTCCLWGLWGWPPAPGGECPSVRQFRVNKPPPHSGRTVRIRPQASQSHRHTFLRRFAASETSTPAALLPERRPAGIAIVIIQSKRRMAQRRAHPHSHATTQSRHAA